MDAFWVEDFKGKPLLVSKHAIGQFFFRWGRRSLPKDPKAILLKLLEKSRLITYEKAKELGAVGSSYQDVPNPNSEYWRARYHSEKNPQARMVFITIDTGTHRVLVTIVRHERQKRKKQPTHRNAST